MRASIRVAALLATLPCAMASDVHAGCVEPVSMMHQAMVPPAGGALDFSGTAYASGGDRGPELRFWAYDNFAEANSGAQNQYVENLEWLVHPRSKFKLEVPASYWLVYQPNWFGEKVFGCIKSTDTSRSVVEVSFADPAREGSTEHVGYYVVLSIEGGPAGANLDKVLNAEGGRVIPVAPIPAPRVKDVEKSGKQTVATVELEPAVSYGEGGLNKPVNLVAGMRLYYALGKEPTSSKPDAFKPVLDPDSGKELGLVPVGTKRVKVAVPASESAWLVARIQYADPTTTLLSNAVSAHVPLEASASDGGRSRRRGR